VDVQLGPGGCSTGVLLGRGVGDDLAEEGVQVRTGSEGRHHHSRHGTVLTVAHTSNSCRHLPRENILMQVLESFMSKINTAGELLQFFWQHKWWWLTPMLLLLLFLGFLIVFAQSSAVAPFIYTLF
jgi:Family of unknown function (DUF5989)